METFHPTRLMPLPSELVGQPCQAFTVDRDGRAWLLLQAPSPGARADTAAPHQPLRLVSFAESGLQLDRVLQVPTDWVSHLEPIGDDLLVVCARADERGAGRWDDNAWVIDRQGRLLRAFTLGDGIEDVQVADDGTIWTTYFDEGLYGSFPGTEGLMAWDAQGRPLPARCRRGEVTLMTGVDLLNAGTGDGTWFGADGQLVRLGPQGPEAVWGLPITYGKGLAVRGHRALVYGGLDAAAFTELASRFTAGSPSGGDPGWHSALLHAPTLRWLSLQPSGLYGEITTTATLRTSHDDGPSPSHLAERGSRLHLLTGTHVITVDVDDEPGR